MTLKIARAFFRNAGKLVDGCFECLCSDEKLVAMIMLGMVIGIAAELRRSLP